MTTKNRRGDFTDEPLLFSLYGMTSNARNPTIRGLLLCLCLLLAQAPEADARNDLRLSKTTDLPNLGIRIKLMPEAREIPLPPPSIIPYVMRRKKVDMYPASDLWIQSQHAGQWVDERGNSLTLAKITLLFPPQLRKKMAPREAYDEIISNPALEPAEWSPELLAQWAADFVGVESAKAEPMPRKPSTLKNLVTFSFDEYPEKLAYAFRLNRSSSGQSKAPESWFFTLFDVARQADPDKARKAILEEFLPSITCAKATATDEVGPSRTFQKKTDEKFTRSPEFIASRDQIANSIKNMKDWWFVETENYIIISDLKSKYRSMVKDLQTYIECLRDAYSQLIPAPSKNTAISVVRVFGTPEEYEEYVPVEIKWSGGVWMPDKKELVIKPIDWGGSREQRENVLRVTAHEGFHQYLFYALGQVPASPWFNEGHADFFAASRLKNNKLIISEERSRTKTIDPMLGDKRWDVQSLLYLSLPEFYSPADRDRNYALAWAIVYYLRKEAEFEPSSPYKNILANYVEALRKTRNAAKATNIAFEGIDLENFQRDLLKFWKSPNKRASAARNRTKGEGKIEQ